MQEKFFEPGAFAEFCGAFTEERNRLRRKHLTKLAAAPREIDGLNRRSKEILELLLQGFRDEKWKSELRSIEERRTALEAIYRRCRGRAGASGPSPHMAEIFRQKATQLATALADETNPQRDTIRQALRGFVDRIMIPPGDELLQVVGNLGEMLTATSHCKAAVGYVGCGGGI